MREGEDADEVWCWGVHGDVTEGGTSSEYPVLIRGLSEPSHPAMSTTFSTGGGYTMCAVDAGNVRCWAQASFSGSGMYSGLLTTPTLVKLDEETPLSGIVDVVGADSQFCALHEQGSIFCWGNSSYASNVGAAGVVALGAAHPAYATSDQKRHFGTSTYDVPCGPL